MLIIIISLSSLVETSIARSCEYKLTCYAKPQARHIFVTYINLMPQGHRKNPNTKESRLDDNCVDRFATNMRKLAKQIYEGGYRLKNV